MTYLHERNYIKYGKIDSQKNFLSILSFYDFFSLRNETLTSNCGEGNVIHKISLLKKALFLETKNRARAVTINNLPPNKYNLFLTAVSVCPDSPTIRLSFSKILHSKVVMFNSHNSFENLPSTCTPP